MKRLDKFHKTKSGHLIFGLVELAISYGFVSLAIDRGNLWWYLFSLIFLIGALNNFFKLVKGMSHGAK